jgi:hypothetical protein
MCGELICQVAWYMSVADNPEFKLLWLQERLRLDNTSLTKLVQANPSVLSCGIDETLGPKLSWLEERLSLDDKSLSKLVQQLPAVL